MTMKTSYKKYIHYTLLTGILICLQLYVKAQTKMIKIACIGNSVTYGYGLTDPQHSSYPAQLQRLLGANYLVGNFGHSGATLSKKGHNPYYKNGEFGAAMAFSPDIAIIHLGLNDTDPRDWPNVRESFEGDYAWLISEIRRSNANVRILICRLTPIFSGHPRFKSGTRDWYDQIQQLIPEIARVNHTELVDLHSPLYSRPELFADNLHPDKEGAGIIAKTIYQSITKQFGDFKANDVFASHMVLQREQPIPIYGIGNAGDMVTVSLGGRKQNTLVNVNGHWKVQFPAMAAGGPYQIELQCKAHRIKFEDVLIGDVWLCSGQSNMAFPLNKSLGGQQELSSLNGKARIRLYQYQVLKETDAVAWDTATLTKINKLQYFTGTWKPADSSAAAGFSAVAYYFGKKVSSETHVPIGLIQVAVGGSPIESWLDRYTLEHDPVLVDVLNNWRTSDFLQDFCRDRANVNLKNATSPKQRHPYEPCYNYEAGINGLIDFPIKGVIWYQGESNAHNLELYAHSFPLLVKSWRQKWGISLPFYYVQLSAIDRPSWPAFRNMQLNLQKQVVGAYMAVSMDVGDSLNVHYINKKPVGERLALQALKHTYQKPLIAAAPDPLYAYQNGRNITIIFPPGTDLCRSSIKAANTFELVTPEGERLPVWPSISGNKVSLSIPAGQQIRQIFYAMQPYTHAGLYTQAALPVPTFILSYHETQHKFLLN